MRSLIKRQLSSCPFAKFGDENPWDNIASHPSLPIQSLLLPGEAEKIELAEQLPIYL